jgi:hypothetical protein
MRTDPELFENWSPEDFDELNSRMGSGGQLTPEGAREMVRRMNHRQELHGKLDLLLETTHAELVAQMIELMYRQSQATDRT